MMYDAGSEIVGATLKKYIPELTEGAEGGVGRPKEGLMGILQMANNMGLLEGFKGKIKDIGAAKAASGNIYR